MALDLLSHGKGGKVHFRAESERLQKALKRDGAALVARSLVARLADAIRDNAHEIQTDGIIPIAWLAGENREFHDYFPTSSWAFRGLMKHLPADAFAGDFIDIGCGLGRALIMAADCPFPSLLGIDISDRLVETARRYVEIAVPSKRANDIRFQVADATKAPMGETATLFYFCNPFRGEPLIANLQNIAASVDRAPRNAYIVFNNTRHIGQIESRLNWLEPRLRIRFEHPCAIYAIKRRYVIDRSEVMPDFASRSPLGKFVVEATTVRWSTNGPLARIIHPRRDFGLASMA